MYRLCFYSKGSLQFFMIMIMILHWNFSLCVL